MKQPNLDRLKSQLLVTGLQNKDNPTFQVISQLIDAVRQFQVSINEDINAISISNSIPVLSLGYWTVLTDGDIDETELVFANGEPVSIFVPL